MVRATTETRVLALRCPECGTALPATSQDTAFRCRQCGRSWEIDGHEFKERRSLHVDAPRRARYRLLFLPYWSFSVSASAAPLDATDHKSLTARDRAAKINRAFVSAYSIYRPTYVGEWGLVYTRLQRDWDTRTGGGPPAPGATIPSDDARTIVKHYVLAEIDRAADLRKLVVEVELGEPELWAIPCYDLGSNISCPWTQSQLPTAMLDDISEIRKEQEWRFY